MDWSERSPREPTSMARQSGPTPLLLVVGPIASGKSTIARHLTSQLRDDGAKVALVELDTIADMARPTLPDWDDAHRIFASVTAQWLDSGLDLVIAEGAGTHGEVELAHRSVPAGTPCVTVMLTCPLDAAFARALADPSRGISRERSFLSRVHERWADERQQIPRDLLLDTDTLDPEECCRRIRDLLDSSRDR